MTLITFVVNPGESVAEGMGRMIVSRSDGTCPVCCEKPMAYDATIKPLRRELGNRKLKSDTHIEQVQILPAHQLLRPAVDH